MPTAAASISWLGALGWLTTIAAARGASLAVIVIHHLGYRGFHNRATSSQDRHSGE